MIVNNRLLNSELHRALEICFGRVIVANEGETAVQIEVYSSITGRMEPEAASHGEYYRVNCPFCSDTRHRLWVNYRWGLDDKNFHLATCFNENCLAMEANWREFRTLVTERAFGFGKMPTFAVEVAPTRSGHPKPMVIPNKAIPIEQLEDGHPARAYLESRKFDPDRIARLYRVSFCGPDCGKSLENRIIIPFWFDRKLVGWQGRYLGIPSREFPKYYTAPGSKKSKLLYNYDRARKCKTLVVCEGPTDVWRIGKCGVALLGKTASDTQLRLIDGAACESVVILLDPEQDPKSKVRGEPHHIESLFESLQRFSRLRGKVAKVYLPSGDPGSWNARELGRVILREASSQGVTVVLADK